MAEPALFASYFVCVVFICMNIQSCQTTSFLTDVQRDNPDKTGVKDALKKANVDLLRQLLNQETIIRLTLSRNVQTLIKEVKNLHQNRKETEKEFKTLHGMFQKETEKLKQEVRDLSEKNNVLKGLINVKFEQIQKEISDFKKADRERDVASEKNVSRRFDEVETHINSLAGTVSNQDKRIKNTIDNGFAELNDTTRGLISAIDVINRNQDRVLSAVASLEEFRGTVSAFMKNITEKLPSSVAFYAYVGTSIKRLNKGQTIIFDHEVIDTSSSYSAQTGIFTAPVSGIYIFNWNLMGNDRAGMDTTLKSTRGSLGYGFIGHARPFNNGGNMVVAKITKGTQVWVVKADTYGNYLHGRFTTFSGFLLYSSE